MILGINSLVKNFTLTKLHLFIFFYKTVFQTSWLDTQTTSEQVTSSW